MIPAPDPFLGYTSMWLGHSATNNNNNDNSSNNNNNNNSLGAKRPTPVKAALEACTLLLSHRGRLFVALWRVAGVSVCELHT